MNWRVSALLIGVAGLVGVIAAARFGLLGGTPPSTTPDRANTQDRHEQSRSVRLEPATESSLVAESILREPPLFARGSNLSALGLQAKDLEAGVLHAAEIVARRFCQREGAQYRRWRLEYGYLEPSLSRLERDPIAHRSILRAAGVQAGGAAPDDLFAAIWRHSVEAFKPVRTFSIESSDRFVVVGASTADLPFEQDLGQVSPFQSQARMVTDPPAALAQTVGRTIGQGWPFWRLPHDVLKRVTKRGTPAMEVIITLYEQSGTSAQASEGQTLALLVVMDPDTRKWWLVQFWLYGAYHQGGGVHGALL